MSDAETQRREVFDKAAELFSLMSTPIRLRIISELCTGERNVGQLLERYEELTAKDVNKFGKNKKKKKSSDDDEDDDDKTSKIKPGDGDDDSGDEGTEKEDE